MSVKDLLNKYIDSLKDKFSENQILNMKFYSVENGIGFLNRYNDIRKVDSYFDRITIHVEFK